MKTTEMTDILLFDETDVSIININNYKDIMGYGIILFCIKFSGHNNLNVANDFV